MPNESLIVRVHAYDRAVLRELFGSESPDREAKSAIDGIEATFMGLEQRHGMSSADIIITVILNFATGVPASLLATWIFQRLSHRGQRPVEVGTDPVVKTTHDEILGAMTQKK